MADEFNDLGTFESKNAATETIKSNISSRESPITESVEKSIFIKSSQKNLKNGVSQGKWKKANQIGKSKTNSNRIHSKNNTSSSKNNNRNDNSKSNKLYSDKEKPTADKKIEKIKPNQSKKKKTSGIHKNSKRSYIKQQVKRKPKNKAISNSTGSSGELGEDNEQTNWTSNTKSSFDSVLDAKEQIKKRFNFIKKKNKFGSGSNKNARQNKFFGKKINESTRDIGKIAKTTKYTGGNIQSGANSIIKNIGQQVSKLFAEIVSPKTLALKFLAVGGSFVGFTLFIIICLFFLVNLIIGSRQQTNSGSSDGVIYVKEWDGKDAYHSSFLAQRYGITEKQIDGFIASQGFKNLDERASGKEFLKLQQESGIDVRVLVAFAQMESSFGTAGVAADYPKSNLFGYGAFDNDPNQGASWDNSRAVKDFRTTQIDGYGNKTLAICDERASQYHSGSLKPGQAVYWTAENSGITRATVEEAFNKYINTHGGTPKPPGGYGPVNTGGGAGLTALDKMIGQTIPGTYGGINGQCYAVSAYYAHGINSKIILRGGTAASDIGSDYDWKGWGWTVVSNPNYSDIKVGDIINFKRGANMGTWNTDSENGHTAVVGKILGGNKLIIYDQNPSPLRTWTYTYNSGVASVIHPPK